MEVKLIANSYFFGSVQGAACELALDEMEYDSARISKLSDRLVNGITSQLDHVIRNGDPDKSYPGCVNLSFAYVEGESLLMALKVKQLLCFCFGHELSLALVTSEWSFEGYRIVFGFCMHFGVLGTKLRVESHRSGRRYCALFHPVRNWSFHYRSRS